MPTGLILSGGGARAAYQVGVLRGISKLIPDSRNSPFDIICGTSAGALNAAKLASEADDFKHCIRKLYALWATLSSDQVHDVGFKELSMSLLRLLGSFFHGGLALGRPLALLDNRPLAELMKREIDMLRLQKMIDQGSLRGLSITALGYTSGHSMSFYQGAKDIKPWRRSQRMGVPTVLSHRHLLASAALPTIFPPVRIYREYFGDGAIRQTAPLSSALHMGADKLLVIGVSGNAKNQALPERHHLVHSPSIAQMIGQLLNSAFIDSMDDDLEMLARFNHYIDTLDEEQRRTMRVKPVEVLTISPKVAFDELAADHVKDLPLSMRVFLKTIGATRKGGGSSLASYVLFESEYCKTLMAEGFKDVLAQADEIKAFFRC
jgi:NTE family protein